ncbi:Alpha/Beta hydrolase protein [Lactifluus subvellereus]|nr:Alpha/Beta hydrolase protein [Lactifluus subvellereus]
MYDEAFSIVRNFMDATTDHTVEELQKFTQLRLPAPPSAHVVRISVPLSCCADAALALVEVFGGEREAKRVVGGVRWWQVRDSDRGIDAEWIMEKKDWRESVRQEKVASATAGGESKTRNGSGNSSYSSRWSLPGDDGSSADDANANTYAPKIDETRCLLWAHGGGYYFGSVDQERYMIQRYARKIHGRVFAPNYRLAPQYPFPCALQDLLASYLFLIRPPEGVAHRPIKPSNIVVGGDSAGGGLAIALLQVIRDAGLPLPAGAVLVSPWCDLHHSFPSIFLNTNTVFIFSPHMALLCE